MTVKWLACIVLLGACPSVTVDQNEGAVVPSVEFDPSNKIVPFPNNLLLDPATGKINLPEGCNESPASAATRIGVLNKLDGFGTYEPVINVTFTEPVDPASLAGNVVLFERVRAGTTADPFTAIPIPVVAIPGKTVRFGNQTDIKACTDPQMIDQVTFVPTRPLHQKSTYTVALLTGIKTANGTDFDASFTWTVIREPEPVVVLDASGNVIANRTPLDPNKAADKAQLAGINLLWNAHHNAVSFLAGTGHPHTELLLAFEFNTQTTTDPLDPTVPGSPAATPTLLPLLGNTSTATAVAGPRAFPFNQCNDDNPVPDDTQCFLRILFGAGNYAVGKATCAAAGCAAVNDVLGSLVLSRQYLTDVPNTLYTGTGTSPIPGAWNDPVHPTAIHNTTNPNPLANDAQAKLGVLVLIPQGTAPAAGWPTVIFQHGITRSRNDVFPLAGALTAEVVALAKQGYAVVSIDAVGHGSRAVRISNATNATPALDCSNVTTGLLGPRPDLGPDPTAKTDCYAPVFSSDLAATRDMFRQTVLDIQQLYVSLQACGTTNCGKLKVNPSRILYVGHSMIGGNLGAIALGTTDFKAGVLDAAGAGWFDIIENTDQTAAFQCPLVDALIDAGVLTGDKFNETANTGLCTTDAWKTMPGYRQFSVIGRWILDPADPANFAARLAPRTFLLQGIDQDDTVPNVATDNLGALAGQLKGDASCGTPIGASIVPSTALLAAPMQSHYLDHLTFAPGDPACPPGNTFGHGSLLSPSPSVLGGSCNPTTGASCDGLFATVRLVTDTVFYLSSND